MSYAENQKATLNAGEYGYLMEGLNSKAIPEPQLLIKNHKEKINNEFLTRLVIPATNFAATFLKLGYLQIKQIFNDNNINYAKYTITQASDLKSKLEKLEIKQNQGTIMSMDIVNMYPSCKLKLIKQAFRHYARNLPPKDKKKIEKCIEMIAFGMKATLICYQDEYFNYKGIVEENGVDGNKDENGLAIGGYESAFCVDVGATYVYKMNENILNKLQFAGTYQDNGLTIFRERLSHRQAIHWLHHFQI
eukprot:15365129-Ditylum_brightwellii.AAC.1